MSLISQAMTDCVMIRKTTRPDGLGGFHNGMDRGHDDL